MTKTDFAELKEKLVKLDIMALSAEYIECCKRRQYNGLVRIEDMVKWQFEKDAAIIGELIDIIQSQSEALDSINNDFGFFHHANKRYIESGKDKQDVTKIGTPIRIATGKLETCVSETTTRLQKLREGIR